MSNSDMHKRYKTPWEPLKEAWDSIQGAALWIYWIYLDKIRLFRLSVAGLLLISVVGLTVQFGAHLAGVPVLLAPHHGATGVVFRLVVIFFLLYLSWKHWKEAQRPRYEYDLTKRLRAFFASGFREASQDGIPMRLSDALEAFHPLFERAKLSVMAVYFETDKKLTVSGNHVHPSMSKEEMESYFPILSEGEGVAGLVYQDSLPRYMPWCSILGRPFRSALQFDFSKDDPIQRYEPQVFKIWPPGKAMFQSLLCVPLASPGKKRGVLQFTFSKSRPLDTSDVTMAVVIGLALSEALDFLVLDHPVDPPLPPPAV